MLFLTVSIITLIFSLLYFEYILSFGHHNLDIITKFTIIFMWKIPKGLKFTCNGCYSKTKQLRCECLKTPAWKYVLQITIIIYYQCMNNMLHHIIDSPTERLNLEKYLRERKQCLCNLSFRLLIRKYLPDNDWELFQHWLWICYRMLKTFWLSTGKSTIDNYLKCTKHSIIARDYVETYLHIE